MGLVKRYFALIVALWKSVKRIITLKSHNQSTKEGLSDERYRRIILTGGSALIVKVISVAINLVTVPLTLQYLGSERYGLWMAISSIMALMAFADMGLGNGLLNEVAKAKGNDDKRDLQSAISSTFFMLSAIATFLLIVFLAIYPFVSWAGVFNVQETLAGSEAGPTVVALIIPMLINMPLGIVQRIQEGNQEGFRFQISLIGGAIISFINLLLCVHFEASLPWLVLAFSSGQLIAASINAILVFTKSHPALVPKWKFFEFEKGKSLAQTGLFFFVLQVFTLMASTLDNIIIAHTIGVSSVTIYEIVRKIFLFSMVTQFLIQPLWPAFREAMEKKDYIWVKKTMNKALLFGLVGGAVITLPLVLFGKIIINYWVGASYEPSWPLLIGFFAYIIIANYGGVMSTFLNSEHLIRKQTIMVGLAATSSVVLKILLAQNFGVSGVIWATVIGYSIFYIVPSYKLAFGQFKTYN